METKPVNPKLKQDQVAREIGSQVLPYNAIDRYKFAFTLKNPTK